MTNELHGTTYCVRCLVEFTEDNPCWNSWCDYEDGSHDDGICKGCSQSPIGNAKYDYQSAGGGYFVRGE